MLRNRWNIKIHKKNWYKKIHIKKIIKWLCIFISVGFSIWAIALVHAHTDNPDYEFSYTALGTLVGIFVTVVGVFFSLYFVIIGMDVNQKSKDIDDSIKEIGKLLRDSKETIATLKSQTEEEIKNSTERSEIYYKLYEKSIIDHYSTMIGVIRSFANKTQQREMLSYANSLNLEKSRIECVSKYLSVEDKKTAITEMVNSSNTKEEIDESMNIIRMIKKSEYDDLKQQAQEEEKNLNKKLRGLKNCHRHS